MKFLLRLAATVFVLFALCYLLGHYITAYVLSAEAAHRSALEQL